VQWLLEGSGHGHEEDVHIPPGMPGETIVPHQLWVLSSKSRQT